MTRDLAREIETALTDLIDPELHDSMTVADAVRAVMQEHEHTFLNRWYRETDDVSAAEFGSCQACGNNSGFWCATVTAIATALGTDAVESGRSLTARAHGGDL